MSISIERAAGLAALILWADNAEAGRILRNAWKVAVANAAHELYRENVAKEDAA